MDNNDKKDKNKEEILIINVCLVGLSKNCYITFQCKIMRCLHEDFDLFKAVELANVEWELDRSRARSLFITLRMGSLSKPLEPVLTLLFFSLND